MSLVDLFTAEEKRRVSQYYPSLSDRPEGLGQGGLLGLIQRRLADKAYGASSIAVDHPEATNVQEALVGLGSSLEEKVSAESLADTSNGNGASLVGIEDAAGLRTEADVEAALAADALAFSKLKSGTITVAIGQSTGTAVVGAGYNGKPVVAVISQAVADGTLTTILRAVVAGGTLTVYGDANATAAVTVTYFIDGR